MSGWVHVEAVFESTVGGRTCRQCYESGGLPICTTPTPDPMSPCGHKRHRADLPCGATATDDWHDKRTWWQDPGLYHPHKPTRCTCGHSLVEVKS